MSLRLQIKEVIAQFLRREAHPAIQFVKYGIAGGIATVTHIVAFFALSLWVFPAMLPDTGVDAILVRWLNVEMPILDEAVRQRRFMINNGLAFLLSNLVAYLINFHWVFHPGRHRRHIEAGLFLTVSTVSLLVGMQIGVWIMRWTEQGTVVAQFGNVFSSVMINYVCRKFIVFKG